jgi:hypothetical protein
MAFAASRQRTRRNPRNGRAVTDTADQLLGTTQFSITTLAFNPLLGPGLVKKGTTEMSKIDHVELGLILAGAREKQLKLAVAASAAFPRKARIVKELFAGLDLLDQSKVVMDRVYHAEVSDAEFKKFGHPYYPLKGHDFDKIDIGIDSYRPNKGRKKLRWSEKEMEAAGGCLEEIVDGLECALTVLDDFGSCRRARNLLSLANIRCLKAWVQLENLAKAA